MRTLQPPLTLEDDFFVLIWERDTDVYILSLKDGRSFEIGETEDARAFFKYHFENGKYAEIGQRGMDSARNWYVAVVIPEQNRCFGVETEESQSEYDRLFKTEPEPLLIV